MEKSIMMKYMLIVLISYYASTVSGQGKIRKQCVCWFFFMISVENMKVEKNYIYKIDVDSFKANSTSLNIFNIYFTYILEI